MSPEGEARGRHEFSGWDKSSCLPTNWAIIFLLYRKLKHDVIQRRALCRETRQGNTTSGGKHDDLFSLHVTSLDQSYFFIRHINYMRYNNMNWSEFGQYFSKLILYAGLVRQADMYGSL